MDLFESVRIEALDTLYIYLFNLAIAGFLLFIIFSFLYLTIKIINVIIGELKSLAYSAFFISIFVILFVYYGNISNIILEKSYLLSEFNDTITRIYKRGL